MSSLRCCGGNSFGVVSWPYNPAPGDVRGAAWKRAGWRCFALLGRQVGRAAVSWCTEDRRLQGGSEEARTGSQSCQGAQGPLVAPHSDTANSAKPEMRKPAEKAERQRGEAPCPSAPRGGSWTLSGPHTQSSHPC